MLSMLLQMPLRNCLSLCVVLSFLLKKLKKFVDGDSIEDSHNKSNLDELKNRLSHAYSEDITLGRKCNGLYIKVLLEYDSFKAYGSIHDSKNILKSSKPFLTAVKASYQLMGSSYEENTPVYLFNGKITITISKITPLTKAKEMQT